jgi:hypothetical protein
MFPQRLLFVALIGLLTLTTALVAQDNPKLAETKNAIDECEKLHVVGLGDASFFSKHGPTHSAAWKTAAEAGDPRGQWLWGRCLQEGVGGPAKPEEAMRWYRKAADKKEGLGMNALGENYEQGIGVVASARTAVSWYRKGKANGSGLATINLGRMYLNGKGVERDYVEAAKCFHAATEGGYSEGASNLGAIAEKGFSLNAPDKALAAKWYRQAVVMGNKEAEKDLERVEGTDGRTANKPPRDSKPPANKPPAGKPPGGQKFRGRSVPGIAKHPLGPSGFHGPAPAFTGTWNATLRNEDDGKNETLSYHFDDQGNLCWDGKTPLVEVGKVIEEKIPARGQGVVVFREKTLDFLSVQPSRVEYLLWEKFGFSNGRQIHTEYSLKRFIFTPVRDDADRLHMELWINEGVRPTIQGELKRVKGGD